MPLASAKYVLALASFEFGKAFIAVIDLDSPWTIIFQVFLTLAF